MKRWYRHHWTRRTVIDDMGLVHPCECVWYRRLWALVRGR